MIERVILMCAGRAERWGNHLGVPKHLISIDGETMLDRTLRLVRKYTPTAVVIVAFNPQYTRPGHERYEPEHGPVNFCDTDKFLSAECKWGLTGQTVLLYGDVFFTDAAMRTILSYAGPHQFFGRPEWSHYTGRQWRELFAISFPAGERQFMHEQLTRLRSDFLAGRSDSGSGWHLYHQMHGRGWDHFITIDDFTDDFDFPDDYDQWLKRYRNPLHRAIVPIYSRQLKRWRFRLRSWRRRLTDAAETRAA